MDWKTRAWEGGPQLPATLGWDLAGVVTASNHSRYRPGDQVIGMSAQIATSRGTWAEQVSLPARLLAAAPTTLAPEDAAALPLAGVTALQALSRAAVTDGDDVLRRRRTGRRGMGRGEDVEDTIGPRRHCPRDPGAGPGLGACPVRPHRPHRQHRRRVHRNRVLRRLLLKSTITAARLGEHGGTAPTLAPSARWSGASLRTPEAPPPHCAVLTRADVHRVRPPCTPRAAPPGRAPAERFATGVRCRSGPGC